MATYKISRPSTDTEIDDKYLSTPQSYESPLDISSSNAPRTSIYNIFICKNGKPSGAITITSSQETYRSINMAVSNK